MLKYAIAVQGAKEFDAVITQLNSEGITKGVNLNDHGIRAKASKPNGTGLYVSDTNNYISWGSVNHAECPVLAFAQYAAVKNISLFPAPVTIKLTDRYDAVVNYEKQIVQVGCQSVPFAKIEELFKLLPTE